MQNQTPNHTGQVRSVAATPRGLVRSTLLSGGAALAVLAVVYLPAEYGIDPTGFGAVLGLTEMGQIKQQLYAEAEADAAAQPVTLDPAVLARLDRIEEELTNLTTLIGRQDTGAASGPAAAEMVTETAPEPEADDTAVTEVAAAEWRDEVSYTLAPGEGIEVKLVMDKGQTARFSWTANGSVVNYDTHGDGSGQKVSYEQGRAVPEQAGELTAAFSGNHGWFWRNRTDAPVTVTLRTAGDYSRIKAP